MKLIRIAGIFICFFLIAMPDRGQSVSQPSTKVIDSYDKCASGGSNSNKRICMEIWLEKTPHADGSYTWALNYRMRAEDLDGVGNWKRVNELYNITFTFKYATTFAGVVTRSGNLSKDHRDITEGVLWDGTDRGPGFINNVSISVTGQRYGGAHGITISYQY